MKTLLTAAQRAGVDLRELIIEVSKVEQVKVTAQIADRVADQLAGTSARKAPAAAERAVTIELPERAGTSQQDLAQCAREIAQEIFTLAAKSGKTSVFAIAPKPKADGGPTTAPRPALPAPGSGCFPPGAGPDEAGTGLLLRLV